MAFPKWRSLFLTALMVGMLALPMASASDIDGDGVEDSSDDCPYAPGNSSTDRTGCPDRDGDGKSDWNDAWTSLNPNFQKDLQISQNYDFRCESAFLPPKVPSGRGSEKKHEQSMNK